MSHNVPAFAVDKYSKAPSPLTVSKASAMQLRIREVLGSDFETFLQGSYKNDTGTSDLNDVDIVAVRKTTHSGRFSHKEATGSVSWETIFADIETRLDNSEYKGKHYRGDKCITITGGLSADVVPAVHITDATEDPIAIFSFREGGERLNHPRLHWENGKVKNERTNGHYKPIVRMMKNWACAHFEGTKIAPSFFVECLVHSAADDQFSSDHFVGFLGVALDIWTRLGSTDPISNVAGTRNILEDWPLAHRQAFRNQLGVSISHFSNAFRAAVEAEAARHWHAGFGN